MLMFCELLNVLEAVRTRYRIARHLYDSFYKDRIQCTLANCLYNEGQRKKKKEIPTDKPVSEQRTSLDTAPSMSSITFD